MKIICVDDEELVLNLIVYMCEQFPFATEVNGFTSAGEALLYHTAYPADVALLDIDMPEINGIELAVELKKTNPGISVIFLTGHSQYAVEAFRIHAQGYLLKPINKEKLLAELEHVESLKAKPFPKVFVRTFGEFDLLVGGTPVRFSRSKAKELLAYLVDKQGAGVSRKDVFAALYEDVVYDRKMQKQLDVIIRSLRDTLAENGVGDIVDIRSGMLRVNPETFSCDFYRLLAGDTQAVSSYCGQYMSAYAWASVTEAFIDRILNKNLSP